MADNLTIMVGTVGQGIIRSGDNGETWRREIAFKHTPHRI